MHNERSTSRLRRFVAAGAAVLMGGALAAVPSGAATGDDVLINEILISTTSTDVEYAEFIGTPGFSLEGLSFIGIEADVDRPVGTIDFRIDFTSNEGIGTNGFFLIGNDLVLGTYGVEPDVEIPGNAFENSSATYALVPTSSLGGGLPSAGDVLDAVHVTDPDDDPALLGAPSVGPDGPFFPAGVRRAADGVDTDTAADWVFSDFFNGSDNTPTAGGFQPEPTALTIMEIQGAGHLSPVDGELVVTSGVVTAVAFNGFYLQDVTGDGDNATSDGIFVSGPRGFSAGDLVEVVGTVEENIPGGPGTGNLSITRINGSEVVPLGTAALPEPVEIGVDGRLASATTVISDDELPINLQVDPGLFDPENDAIDFWEALEGMYVEVDEPVSVSATRTFNRFSSEFFTLPSRGKNAVIEPDDARTQRGGIELQPSLDNTGDQNPERVQLQFDGTIYPADVPAVAVNTRLDDVVGVVGYSFGNFEVNVTEEVSFLSNSIQPEQSPLQPLNKHLTVASYNVLNLDPGDTAQLETVGGHIATNLQSPDIVALQEIQDNNGTVNDGTTAADQTLAALVAAIENAGGPTYVAVDVAPIDNTQGGVPGGNIRNAYLYNPDRVSLVELQDLNPTVLSGIGVTYPSAFDGSRIPLLGVFEFQGKELTVINNHFSSRFGSSPIFGGPQPFFQAGEVERNQQSLAVNEVVDSILADDSDARVIVTGDLNTFQWTDELAEVLPGVGGEQVLTNLVDTFSLLGADRDNKYTFIFDGNSQALDHMFVTDNLLDGNTKFDIVHVNVDFPRVDSSTGSDHEPLLARFRL